MGVINLVSTTVMAILFAIILNEVKSAIIKKPIQTVSYLPHFLSWIVVTGILHNSLSPTGIVNDLLLRFGLIDQAINFFAYPKYFWPIVAFANCWKETGWNAIIYLAAITSIDPSLLQQSGSAENAKNGAATITPITIRAAVTVVTMLPIICLYPFLQRYFVTGLTIGGVKE